MARITLVGAALTWTLFMLASSCSSVNINCNYFKVIDGKPVPTCVEERDSGIPIHRGKDL